MALQAVITRTPILATGSSIKSRPFTARHSDRKAPHGFTLLEVLVVVALFSLVLTFAVLETDGGRGRMLEDAARQLTATTMLVEQEAILRRRPLGMVFYRNGYQVVQFEIRWSAPETDPLYRHRYLPSGIDVVGAPARGLDVNRKPLEPRFVMFPDGDIAMRELILANASGRSLRLVPQDGQLRVRALTR